MGQDIEWVRRHQSGDSTATANLVRRYQDMVYAVVFRLCQDHAMTEDLVQDTFVRAFERIHQFEARSSFKTWLYRIAINLTKNVLTSYRFRNVTGLDGTHQQESHAPNQEELHGQKQIQHVLRDLILTLPAKQQTSVMLRIFEDLSFSEIAQVMECPFDTAKANYRHGIQALKKKVFGTQGGLARELRENLRALDRL